MLNHYPPGGIEVICGPMFSGKSEELIRRLTRAIIAKQNVVVYKPAADTRYGTEEVVSHSHQSIGAVAVRNTGEMHDHIRWGEEIHVIGIDEVQFFDADVVRFCTFFADTGKRVIAAGLDMDYRSKPFGPMPELLAVADSVTKLQAICVNCGNYATRSHRLSTETAQQVLGATDKYQALCRDCYAMYAQYDGE